MFTLNDPMLKLTAEALDDLEGVRIANENRLRQLTRSETDADGEDRGFGLTLDHPDVKRFAAIVEALAAEEHRAVLQLQRLVRRHPLGPWLAAQPGIGEKQGARLLAAIGDPYMRPEMLRPDGTIEPARPRTVSELWAYCGYHVLRTGQATFDTQAENAGPTTTPGGHGSTDARPRRAAGPNSPAGQHHDDAHTRVASGPTTPGDHRTSDTQWTSVAGSDALPGGHGVVDAQHNDAAVLNVLPGDQTHGDTQSGAVAGEAARRRRGVRSNWSDDARMRAHLIAASCVKQPDGTRWRDEYTEARRKYDGAAHRSPCVRCGPSGKPAAVGSLLSAGHQHARALRIVVKAILRELWRESGRLHGDDTSAPGRLAG